MGMHFVDSDILKEFTEGFSKRFGSPKNVKDGCYNNRIEDITSFTGLYKYLNTIFQLEDVVTVDIEELEECVKRVFDFNIEEYSPCDVNSNNIRFTGHILSELESLEENKKEDIKVPVLLCAAGYALVRTGNVSYRLEEAYGKVNNATAKIILEIFKELVLGEESSCSYIRKMMDAKDILTIKYPAYVRMYLIPTIAECIIERDTPDEEYLTLIDKTLSDFHYFTERLHRCLDRWKSNGVAELVIKCLVEYIENNVFFHKTLGEYFNEKECLAYMLGSLDWRNMHAVIVAFVASLDQLGSLSLSDRSHKMRFISELYNCLIWFDNIYNQNKDLKMPIF